SGLKRVVKIGMGYRLLFSSVAVIAVLSAAASSIRPLLIGTSIDKYIAIEDSNRNPAPDLNGLADFMLILGGVLLLEVILNFFVIYLANKVAQRVIRYLRVRLFDHIIKFKLGYFDRTPNGVLVTRSVSDIETIAEIFNNGILTLMVDALRIIFIISLMY